MRLILALLGALVLAGCTAPADSPPSQAPAIVTDWVEPPEPDPAAIKIASIGARSSVVPTGLDAAGGIVVPEDAGQAAWFDESPRPGETGPAVIIGHVNNRGKVGIFRRLAELGRGDIVEITQSTGNVVLFEVYEVRQYPKSSFDDWGPTVLGDTRGPELRLISCGGRFDEATRSYEDNVIALARELP